MISPGTMSRISSLRWVLGFKEVFLNALTRHVIFLVLMLINSNLLAESHFYKIGFVNTSRVLKEAPQARRVEERLKAEFQPREVQLKEKRQEILDIEEQLKTFDQSNTATRKVSELRGIVAGRGAWQFRNLSPCGILRRG